MSAQKASAASSTSAGRRQHRAAWLQAMLWICHYLAHSIASLYFVGAKTGLLRVSPCVRAAPGGLWRVLVEVWFAKLLREALAFPLKTRLRADALALVDCDLPHRAGAGTVIALSHTPWARLLAEWCRARQFGVIVAGAEWPQRTGQLAVSGGVGTLLRLVRHLRAGGRAVVIADSSPRTRGTRVRFLGEERSVSLLPVRLACAARVPVLPAVAYFQDGLVHLRSAAPASRPSRGRSVQALTLLLAGLEHEIRTRPATWNNVLKHPRAS